tara:strand:- start:615 stop:848 length:234 start_codon:yes stop_codon:yes gene_type:complete
MAKFEDAQTITGEVNINYVLNAYSKKLTSIMSENILLQAKVSELEEQNENLSSELTKLYTKVNNGDSNKTKAKRVRK